MFYSLIPLFIIFLSLAGIIIIIIRKFPQLAALDVDKIEDVKQAKVKEELSLQRFNRGLQKIGAVVGSSLEYLSFLVSGWRKIQNSFRIKVHQIREKYKKSIIEDLERKEEKSEIPEGAMSSQSLVAQADEVFEKGDLTFAERKYIEAIRLDPRNIEAYRGLGKVYMDMEKYKEAEETFKFITKLNPRDDRIFNRLGIIEEQLGNYEEAAEYFKKAIEINGSFAIRFYDLGILYARLNKPAAALKAFLKAVKIEPNNPKYLDQLLEMSIITRDLEMAESVLERLMAVNPDNQKLGEFRQKIGEIKE